MTNTPGNWGDENTAAFLDYGRYFVPEREYQLSLICDLVPPPDGPCHILELACGEGLLAAALLARFPQATVHGLDGSPAMLERARARLAPFGARFQAGLFDLAADDWRRPAFPAHAVVSSLAVHHLDDDQKQRLFADIHAMLAPGGVLLIADVVQPADERGARAAADAWDAAVRRRALELDGTLAGFEAFERERWNMYRYPETDPQPFDKPSRLIDQLIWLVQAGFTAVDAYWMLAGHAVFGGRKRP
jgi:tRNA (cmo5U34)-methyltransferase